MTNLTEILSTARDRLTALHTQLSIATLPQDIAKLQAQTKDPHFWEDQSKATQVSQELVQLQKRLADFNWLVLEQETLSAIGELLQKHPDTDMQVELVQRTTKLESLLGAMEGETYFTGKYDHANALLSIAAGQGGTEAMDWSAMLWRMYSRYIAKSGWQHEIVDQSLGEEAGIKSITVRIVGKMAYGWLKNESGIHRLVRLSPFNAQNLRQTSFAKVEVLPLIEAHGEIKLKPEDVQMEAFRSGGSGGQNVNKVSTAVRLIHIPSGMVVVCQSQRSQEQNRKIAEEMLRAKLWEQEEEKRRQETLQLKGDNPVASWGRQIRSYVLHPYKLVKDVRTGVESNDPYAVLDGFLDEFLQAGLHRAK